MSIIKSNRILILILTFFMAIVFAQSTKSSIFVHPSVAEYHVGFLNGDRDSVLRFQQKHYDLIKDKYVYIAYLHRYCNHYKYGELLRAHN